MYDVQLKPISNPSRDDDAFGRDILHVIGNEELNCTRYIGGVGEAPY